MVRITKEQRGASGVARFTVSDTERSSEENRTVSGREELGDLLVGKGVPFSAVERVLGQLEQANSALLEVQPRIGPKIARALFDTVCNPLIESLELELALIERRNWTFSFRPKTLELIKPYRQYIETRAWPNLDQLLDIDPDINGKGARHDTSVQDLLEAAKNLYDSLIESPSFIALCDSFFQQAKIVAVGYKNIAEIFGAYPPADHMPLIAQHIVNNSGELPSYYSSARFWNYHQGELLGLLQHPETRGPHDTVRRCGENLTRASQDFVDRLKHFRGEQSSLLDVPAFAGEQHQRTA